MTVILGLDLSATAAACVALSTRWDGDFSRVFVRQFGADLRKDATDVERARRTEHIAQRIVEFARGLAVTEAWIEGYAFSMRTASHTLGEVGGVVRLELVRVGIDIHTANMSAARKLLLGKLPKKGAKVAAHQALRAAGSPLWTLDESDAFVCANLGLSEHAGAFCFATEPPEPEPRKRKGKTG